MSNVIKHNRKVDWVDLGEGLSGDYDPNDPNDVAMLRFDVLELQQVHEHEHTDDGVIDHNFGRTTYHEWVAMDDASYCTQMPADTSDDILRRGATMIMNATYGKDNIKKICEGLSWIEPGWCVEPQLNG
jgi:hypothetical protein